MNNLDIKLRIGYEFYLAIRDHGKELNIINPKDHISHYLDMLPEIDDDGIMLRLRSRFGNKNIYEYVPSSKLLNVTEQSLPV